MAHEYSRRIIRYFRFYLNTFGLRFAVAKLFNERRDPGRENIELIPQKILSKLPVEQYPEYLKKWYFSKTGKTLDLENPTRLTEKIQWLKLYDDCPEKTIMADKYAVREWVAEKIGEEHLIPLLGVWSSFDEIDFQNLPEKFVLKCTHGSGCNLVVTDKNVLDIQAAKQNFDFWMKLNYAFVDGFELQYKNVIPRIIAETYVETSKNDLPDYKIHCFNGVPRFVQMISNRRDNPKEAFFDLQWKRTIFRNVTFPLDSEEIEKPKQLEKMVQIAKKLSDGIPYVRVDLYIPDETKVLFGEMTFTPASGTFQWEPQGYDEIMGSWLTLPETARRNK